MRGLPRNALSALLLSATFTSASHAEVAAPLQSEDLFRLESAADPQIRPQGDVIAYVRRTPDIMTDRTRGSIWLVDARTGAQTPFATGPGSYSQPIWSPDGQKLAYVSNAEGSSQIYVASSDGSKRVRITNVEQSPSAIAWSPDGTQIAFAMFVPGKRESFGTLPSKPADAKWAPPLEVYTDEGYRQDSAGYVPPGVNQIFLVSADGGAARQITNDEYGWLFGPLSWSPDGERIVFHSIRHKPWNNGFFKSEIVSVDVEHAALTVLTHRNGPDENPQYSPDGKWIAYVGFDDHGKSYQNRELYIMRPDGRDAHSISGLLDRSIDGFSWNGDSRSLLIFYTDRGENKLARLAIEGNGSPAVQLAQGFEGEFSQAENGAIAYTTSDIYAPSNIAIKSGKSVRTLTRLNHDLLAHRSLGKVTSLQTRAPDGIPVQGWMVTPPNADPTKKLPLILVVHGGPFSAYVPEFRDDYQLLAAAGYAVIYYNPRGSTSYGEDFANLIDRKFPGPDYADAMAVIDAAIATGRIDERNLFVTGASYGGVMTGWIIGKTNRFNAAVMQKPITNFVSATLGSDQAGYITHSWFDKFPWEDVESYWKRSPLSLIGNVETPTMLMVGAEDFRTPDEESVQYFTALRLRGIPTAYLRIPGVGHQTTGSRPSQKIGQLQAILAWFDRYRKNP
tara:strand:- start:102032 stop:104056 length:2025 start_codon:yes stop_codon:yes gene_type:complete